MREIEKVDKIKNWVNILLVFSIILLMLTSFLPWISVEEGNQSKYFNYEMIKTSDINQIYELSYKIDSIVLYLWLIIIIGITVLIASSFYFIKRLSFITNIIFLIGFSTLIFSALLAYTVISLLIEIVNMQSINLAFYHNFFGYCFFILIFVFLTLFSSLVFSINSFSFSFEKLKKSNKEQKSDSNFNKNQSYYKYYNEKSVDNKVDTTDNKKPSKTLAHTQKIDAEEWSEEEEKKEVRLESKIEESKKSEEEKTKTPEPKEEKIEEEIEEITPAEHEEEIIEEVPKETVQTNDSFEDILYSAIEKKKKEKTEVSEKYTKEDTTKKYKVKCSECKNIFTVKIEKGTKKIKCPKCGKEGKLT